MIGMRVSLVGLPSGTETKNRGSEVLSIPPKTNCPSIYSPALVVFSVVREAVIINLFQYTTELIDLDHGKFELDPSLSLF